MFSSFKRQRKKFKQILKNLSHQKTWHGELENIDKEGEIFWTDTVVVPLRDPLDHIVSYMVISFDITKDKINANTIEEQQKHIIAQSKLSALGEMAGSIAHEINNPLAIIMASIYSIKKMEKKDALGSQMYHEALQDIEATVKRITQIVSGLRNISRDSTDEKFLPCSVSELLNDVLPLCKEKLNKFDIEFKTLIDEKTQFVQLDLLRVQMSQVILNLINNACDEIENKEEKWIKFEAMMNNDQIKISITDSGYGIDQEVQEKIFQPFFTTKELGKGTDLGLSLSQKIVSNHKGKLYIDNQNSNTSFIIELPLKQ